MRAGALGGGKVERPATADEVATMQSWLREALEAGAGGMSAGLIYAPARYYDTDANAPLPPPLGVFGPPSAPLARGADEASLVALPAAAVTGLPLRMPQPSHPPT